MQLGACEIPTLGLWRSGTKGRQSASQSVPTNSRLEPPPTSQDLKPTLFLQMQLRQNSKAIKKVPSFQILLKLSAENQGVAGASRMDLAKAPHAPHVTPVPPDQHGTRPDSSLHNSLFFPLLI